MLTSLFGGQGLASSVQSALGDVVAGVLKDIVTAVVSGAGDAGITSGPAVDTVAAAPEAPVMTVAVEPDALAATNDPMAVLGGDGGGGPAAEPLAWAALAASRQEDLAGPTPEVVPVAAVGDSAPAHPAARVGAVVITISGISKTGGPVDTAITLTGNYLNTVKVVKFGCASNACDWGVDATPEPGASGTSLTVKVPQGAPSGYIQVTNATSGATAFSKVPFTVTGILPSIADFTPEGYIGGSQVVINGSNFTDAIFVNFGDGSTTSFDVNPAGTQITVAVPDGATTGRIVVGLPTGGVVSATNFTVPTAAFPSEPTGGKGTAFGAFSAYRLKAVNAISAAVGAALPASGPAGTCTKDGCPIPLGSSQPSVANTIGEYGYNLLLALSSKGLAPV